MAVDPDINILVVDDFGTMVRIVQGLLQQAGFRNIEHVVDGASALERSERSNPAWKGIGTYTAPER